MANIRIITSNDADEATLSASPAVLAALPVGNLQTQSRARVMRTNSVVNAQHILGNFSEVKYLSALALVRHNLTSAASWRLRLYDDVNQTGNETYDSGTVELGNPAAYGEFSWGLEPWGGDSFRDWPVAFSLLWFTPALALSFDLQIDDAANTDGYLEASRLFMGTYWSPENNMSYGVRLQWVDPSTQERTDGGTLRTDAVESHRRWEFDLSALAPGEAAQLQDILRRSGMRNDLFLSCFPELGGDIEINYAGAVKLAQNAGLVHDVHNNFRTDVLTFDEA